MNILAIDDDPEVLDHIATILLKEHYQVAIATSGSEALRHIRMNDYALFLVGSIEKSTNGLEIIKQIRTVNSTKPLLMLTPEDSIDVITNGLNFGADDYLATPFSPSKLLVRVRVLLAQGTYTDKIMKVGHIQLNRGSREVRSNGDLLFLTAKEYSILEFLLLNRNQAVSRLTLTQHIWGDNFDANMSNSLDVHMKNLRKKLSVNNMAQLIVTVRGFGFRLDG